MRKNTPRNTKSNTKRFSNGTTSSPHGPYAWGRERPTVDSAKESEAVKRSKSEYKNWTFNLFLFTMGQNLTLFNQLPGTAGRRIGSFFY